MLKSHASAPMQRARTSAWKAPIPPTKNDTMIRVPSRVSVYRSAP
ncbi:MULTISPECIES: hypothetical protein [Corallococcus]|nr:MULTISPECIES: hypothetical protein [Corallococcus]